MHAIINDIFKDKIAGWSVSISSILLAISLVSVFIVYHLLPPFIPLYNKMTWGYTRIGNTFEIFFPLILLGVFLALNTYIGLKLQQRVPLLARFLFITGLSISIFTAIFIFQLLFIIL